jgi:hypothetical protein
MADQKIDSRPNFIWHVWHEDVFMTAVGSGLVPNLALVLQSYDVTTAAEEAFVALAIRGVGGQSLDLHELVRTPSIARYVLKAQGDSPTAQLYFRVSVKLAPTLTRLEGCTPADLKLPRAMMPPAPEEP